MLAKLLTWVVPVVALLMLGLTLTPAEVWHAPATDAVYRGFDSNLQYVTADGGKVVVSHDTVALTAVSQSQPTINLATTPLQKLNASLEVIVLANDTRGQAFRVGYWSPWTHSGFFVVFGPSPTNAISADAISNGGGGATLSGGSIVTSTLLGNYRLGASNRVEMLLDRAAGVVGARLSDDSGSSSENDLTPKQFPAFFGNGEISLSASAFSAGPPVSVTLRNFVLTLPHERLWAAKVSDSLARPALIALAIAGGVLLVAVAFVAARRARVGTLRLKPPRWSWASLAVVGAIGIYLVGNALLLPLKGHPFDFGYEEFYAYVARTYGPQHLYYLPNVVSLADIWRGVPYLEAAFPYEPAVAYLSAGIGWITSILFAGGGVFARNSVQLGEVIKSVNVLFGLADAALIYAILRQINTTKAWSVIAGALFPLQPGGLVQHVGLGADPRREPVLRARRRPACGTPHAVLGVAGSGRRLPHPASDAGVRPALGDRVSAQVLVERERVGSVVDADRDLPRLVPIHAGDQPIAPDRHHAEQLPRPGGQRQPPGLNTVSQTAYSIWPLVTYLVQGASGLQRAFLPSSTLLVGPLSYQFVSQVLTLAAMLSVSAILLFRRRSAIDPGGYLPLVALGIASFLMLLTGLVATHFLLALPFLLLSRRWMGTVAYLYIAAIWTVSTLVPMFGEMAISVPLQQYPLLAAQSGAITNFAIQMYGSDRFITTAIVANICAVIWLAFVAFRRAPIEVRPAKAA